MLESYSIMYILYIVAKDEASKAAYTAVMTAYMSKPFRERDAGFDLCCAKTTLGPGSFGTKIPMNAVIACLDTHTNMYTAYWMLPRSSISKTPIRLANSVGLIDAGYRGMLLAVVDNHRIGEFVVNDGDRYFQVCTPTLAPWTAIEFVDAIPGGETLRGAGGFGSTGLTTDIDIPANLIHPYFV